MVWQTREVGAGACGGDLCLRCHSGCRCAITGNGSRGAFRNRAQLRGKCRLPLAAFVPTGAWVDLARPDSLFLGLIIIIYGTLYLGYHPPRFYVPITDDPIGNIKLMLIPSLILGFGLSASIMRMTRSTVLEALHEDYARTARAKGLKERTVVIKHVLRNALIPVMTLVGNQAAFIFSGALIIEILFVLPGMGRLTIEAIQQRDYPQVQGCALIAGAAVVTINLFVDVAYGWVDPRVKYG